MTTKRNKNVHACACDISVRIISTLYKKKLPSVYLCILFLTITSSTRISNRAKDVFEKMCVGDSNVANGMCLQLLFGVSLAFVGYFAAVSLLYFLHLLPSESHKPLLSIVNLDMQEDASDSLLEGKITLYLCSVLLL